MRWAAAAASAPGGSLNVGPTRTRILPGRGKSAPAGSAWKEPRMPTGTMGTSAPAALLALDGDGAPLVQKPADDRHLEHGRLDHGGGIRKWIEHHERRHVEQTGVIEHDD